MKNNWVLLFCGLLFAGGSAFAQTGVGLRGGPSFSQVSFTTGRGVPRPPQGVVQGMEAGFFWRILNNERLGIQAEVNYSSKGWHIYPGTLEEHLREFQYLQVPLLSHLQLGRGKLKLIVQAGAFVAYAWQTEDVVQPGPGASPRVVYGHQASVPWQFGVLGGGGPAFELPLGMLQLEARFAQHLSHVLRPDFSRTDDFQASHQQTITFALQWVYMFEKKR